MTKTKTIFNIPFFFSHSNTLRTVPDAVHLCANAFTLGELITLMHVKNVRTKRRSNRAKEKKRKKKKRSTDEDILQSEMIYCFQ